jgi:hypothetical protein
MRNPITRVSILAVLVSLLLAAPARAGAVDYVIHISVDGLRSDLLQTLLTNDGAGEYFHFQRLVDEGASTFNARTDYTHTLTIPNHTSMLTGRPVLQPSGQPNTVHHGYTNNSDPGPTDTLHNRGNPNVSYVASVFDVVHDNGLTTGLYASKSKFVIYQQSYNGATGAADTTGADDGSDKIDSYVNMFSGSPANAANLHAAFIQALSTNPRHYSFVHYRDPDTWGHTFGWGSSGWNSAVAAVDGYLEEIFNVVESSAVLQDRTVVIVTSDHGGGGSGHSDAAVLHNHRIPLFVWGASIRTGVDLYALNADTRADPGSGRPDYNASPPPIRNGDSGNLALHLLGLSPIPGSTINAAQDLAAQSVVAVEPRTMTRVKSLFR